MKILVRDVMVPRTDTVCVEDTSPIDEILETFVDSGHSRIPVYSGTIDNIVGILYAKDVLAALVNGDRGYAAASDYQTFSHGHSPFICKSSSRTSLQATAVEAPLRS